MIDCERDCPSGHRKINWFTDVELDAQCMNCYKEQLEKAEAEIDKANNALEQLSQEHAATLKWYNDLRDACTVNGNTYTLKSLIAQTERLDDEIAKLRALNKAAHETNEEFTAKQDAEIFRLQLIIVGLKAKAEDAREEGYNEGWKYGSMGEDL